MSAFTPFDPAVHFSPEIQFFYIKSDVEESRKFPEQNDAKLKEKLLQNSKKNKIAVIKKSKYSTGRK